jgi:hypothetical protein
LAAEDLNNQIPRVLVALGRGPTSAPPPPAPARGITYYGYAEAEDAVIMSRDVTNAIDKRAIYRPLNYLRDVKSMNRATCLSFPSTFLRVMREFRGMALLRNQ